MKRTLKVKAIYMNAMGLPVEVNKKMTEAQFLTLTDREDVKILNVNGVPAECFVKNIHIA